MAGGSGGEQIRRRRKILVYRVAARRLFRYPLAPRLAVVAQEPQPDAWHDTQAHVARPLRREAGRLHGRRTAARRLALRKTMNCTHTGKHCSLACGCDWNNGRQTSKAEACVQFTTSGGNEVSCAKCLRRQAGCRFSCFRQVHRGMIQFVDRIICGDGRQDAVRATAGKLAAV